MFDHRPECTAADPECPCSCDCHVSDTAHDAADLAHWYVCDACRSADLAGELPAVRLATGADLRAAAAAGSERAADELRRRTCKRAGLVFTRVPAAPAARMVAAPTRGTRRSRYTVSGRPLFHNAQYR